MNIQRALKDERMLKSLIWISKKQFNSLLIEFELWMNDYYKNLTPLNKRKRCIWWWRRWVLKTTEEKLFFILFYIKIYPTFDLAAFVFWTVRSKTCEWTQKFLPILKKSLWIKLILPKRKTTSLEQLLNENPQLKDVFIDWTERPIQRPKKDKNQKKNYSGKKKNHTIKNTIVCDENRKILFLWKTEKWKTHDYRLAKIIDNIFESIPKKKTIWLDTWYQWVKKDYPDNIFEIPKKRTRWKSLTNQEKQNNRTISWIRIIVENAIAGIKKYQILYQKLRNRIYWNYKTVKNNFKDEIVEICCWLHNLSFI